MSRFVLDCSVTMAWCFDDEADVYAERILEALSRGSAVVPSLWSYEVVNVLLVAERRRRLRPDERARFLALLAASPIEVDPPMGFDRVSTLFAIARQHRLSAYDAAYLDVALRERVPLATRSRTARGRACGGDRVFCAVVRRARSRSRSGSG